jgi:hypothetical protein
MKHVIPLTRAVLTHLKTLGITPQSINVMPDGEISMGFKSSNVKESEDATADQLLESWSLSYGANTKTKRVKIPS